MAFSPRCRLAVLTALLALPACNSSPGSSLVVTGNVVFVNIEGGCLVFHGDNGVDYNLFAQPEVGLEGVYEDGAFLEVELAARLGAGYCPGQIAEVLRIISASLPLHLDGLDGLVLMRNEQGDETLGWVEVGVDATPPRRRD